MAESKGLVARFHAWPEGVFSGTRRESKGSWGIVLLKDVNLFSGCTAGIMLVGDWCDLGLGSCRSVR